MFANGSWVKIWKCEKGQGNYYLAQMSTSRKNDAGEYEQDWSDGRVRLVGNAAKQAEKINDGDRMQINNCGVTNKYDKEKKTMYTNYVVFSFEEEANKSAPTKTKSAPTKKSPKKDDDNFMNVPETDDDELPFN